MRFSDQRNLIKSGRRKVYKVFKYKPLQIRYRSIPYKEAWPQVEAALYAIQNSTPSMARVYTIGSGGMNSFQMKSAQKKPAFVTNLNQVKYVHYQDKG